MKQCHLVWIMLDARIGVVCGNRYGVWCFLLSARTNALLQNHCIDSLLGSLRLDYYFLYLLTLTWSCVLSRIESLDYLLRAELCILSSSGIICSHGLSFIACRQTNEDEWKAGKQRTRHYQVRRIERCSWENVIPIIPGTWVLPNGMSVHWKCYGNLQTNGCTGKWWNRKWWTWN